ncbi:MAG: hypothetical protein AAF518_04205 [Spirochaetota bacterium]
MESHTSIESLHCTSCNNGVIEFSRNAFSSGSTLLRKVCPQCNAHIIIYQEIIHHETCIGYVLL